MSRKVVAAICVFLAMISVARSGGRSLWAHRSPRRVMQFADTSARSVGDLLTVVVSETTAIANADTRSMSKTANKGFSWNFGGAATGNVGSAAGNGSLEDSASANRDFAGNASFSSDRGVSDRFTATVTRVLPNGNLIISGRRHVNIDHDVRTAVISGVVRPL